MDGYGVVRIGDGRGFVVETENERLIITAAHCLPWFPEPHGASYPEERTYRDLVGGLGLGATVWAELRFADPVSDLAILGEPDGQLLHEQYRDYENLVFRAAPIRVGDTPADERFSARLLSLDGRWYDCEARAPSHLIWVVEATQRIMPGMSGSPILDCNGVAIGLVSTGSAGLEGTSLQWPQGPNPRLARCLPGWLLAALRT